MRRSLVYLFVLALYFTLEGQKTFHFASGFESGTFIRQYEKNGVPDHKYADVYGLDKTTSFDWVDDLDNNEDIGNFRIYYEVGDTAAAKASISSDPLDKTNSVLKFQLDAANVPNGGHPKGRIQAAISESSNLIEFYFKVRLYIHPDVNILRQSNRDITWFTLMEFWNNVSSKPFPFRITLNIQKPENEANTPLYFGAHAQTKAGKGKWDDVWSVLDTSMEVKVGEWVTLETYLLEGGAESGRYKVILTDSAGNAHTLFDITGFTYHPDDPSPDGFKMFNPMKLYTSGTLIEGMKKSHAQLSVYWDDFEIWTNSNPLSVQNTKAGKIKLYPNPVDQYLMMDDYQSVESIYIHDLTGALKRSIPSFNSEFLDVSALSKGVYIITITKKSGESYHTKMIKR